MDATLDHAEAEHGVTYARVEVVGASRLAFSFTSRGAHALADTRVRRERLWRGVDLRALLASAQGSTSRVRDPRVPAPAASSWV